VLNCVSLRRGVSRKVAVFVNICERRPATNVFPLCGAILVVVGSNYGDDDIVWIVKSDVGVRGPTRTSSRVVDVVRSTRIVE